VKLKMENMKIAEIKSLELTILEENFSFQD
jgi:hypothetical protein